MIIGVESWWRIVIDAEGAVESCESVDHAEKDGRNVFFVRAVNQKDALRRSWRALVRRRTAAGLCRCGRKNDSDPGRRCSHCKASDATYHRNDRLKKKGITVPPYDRAATLAARRESEIQDHVSAALPNARLSALMEVREAWRSAPNNAAFTRWLEEQLAPDATEERRTA